jgi:hypothetical protein
LRIVMTVFGDSRVCFHLEEDELVSFALQYPCFNTSELYVRFREIRYYLCITSKTLSVASLPEQRSVDSISYSFSAEPKQSMLCTRSNIGL